jgi:hypothetical protein
MPRTVICLGVLGWDGMTIFRAQLMPLQMPRTSASAKRPRASMECIGLRSFIVYHLLSFLGFALKGQGTKHPVMLSLTQHLFGYQV